MNSIEKISVINRITLDQEHYVESLIEEAYRHNLLLDVDIERIQMECVELLACQTERYNGDESSSVRVEVAQNIMVSNLYTIGLCLKTYLYADDAVKMLKKLPIKELYSRGRELLDKEIKTAKHIHALVLGNKLHNENYDYNATIVGGIKGFFKIYNPDFDAQEIHITADYPLCNPVKYLVGIEFIVKYLESIYYENMFCQNFTADHIHHLLCGYDKNYQKLLFNIFEQVLTAAIGSQLAGFNSLELNMSENAIAYLTRTLSGKTKGEISELIRSAYQRLKAELTVTSVFMEKYVEQSLSAVAFNIFNAIEMKMLDKVLVKPQYPERNPKLFFSFGDKMEDEAYRKIVNEIMKCRYLSDKMAVIKSEIHSLADLEDVIFDAELMNDEIEAVLNELESTEIAAIAKRHPYKSDIEAVDLSEQEQNFRECLHLFIVSLTQEKQELITKAISIMEDDHFEN